MGARARWRRMLDRGVLTYNISLGRSPQLLGRASKKIKNIQGKIKTCGRPFSDRLTPKRGRTTTKLFHLLEGVPLRQRFQIRLDRTPLSHVQEVTMVSPFK